MRSDLEKQIQRNINAHDRIAKRYERRHGEIYNPREQDRLRRTLIDAVASIETGTSRPLVLDFGCGAGNLTAHMINLGCDVIAADVSEACLQLVSKRHGAQDVSPLLLNGRDLRGVSDESLDMVATYSVLHHVPDYLSLMREFVRVLKPGGVVFIDHELSELYWYPDNTLLAFRSAMAKVRSSSPITKYLVLQNYINWFMCRFINPRYRPEGDIHVFLDDHVEWPKIILELEHVGAKVLQNERYLLFREGYDLEVYEAFASRTHDMESVIARKDVVDSIG
jgi:ubiquinone/menaquinone biosynthesis C-methylase UbiE